MNLNFKIHTFLCVFFFVLKITHNFSLPHESPVPFHNFTSLPVAVADLETFINRINGTLNFPSLLFAFSVRGQIVLKKAWGTADLENNLPAHVNMLYRIGSITKTFTSTLVGRLVDQKLLHFEDLVSKYLPEKTFPAKRINGQLTNMTISQLLSHTSGLKETDTMHDFFTTVDPPANITEHIRRFKDEPLAHAPGTFTYSNNGFQVLGAIIEAVTKKPFQQVMTEFLRSNHFPSAVNKESNMVLHEVPRYYLGQDIRQKLDPVKIRSKEIYPTAPYDDLLYLNGWWATGGIVASLDDMLHYGQLLLRSYHQKEGAILSKETLTKLWYPRVETPQGISFLKYRYGYGWRSAPTGANPGLRYGNTGGIVAHSGGLLGSTAFLMIYPKEEIVAIMLSNKGQLHEQEKMVVYALENMVHLVK